MGKMVKGVIINNDVNRRIGAAHVNAPKAEVPYKIGEEVSFKAAVVGGAYKANNIWYVNDLNEFVWSGCVRLSGDVPTLKKRLIVTCDDYGVDEKINAGIESLIKLKKVNAVAVFPNYRRKGSEALEDKYLKRIRDLKADDTIPTFEIGMHFVINAGKPVLPAKEVPELVDGKGWFITKEQIKPLSADGLEQLRNELEAQVKRFRDLQVPLDFLTSNNNALTFTEGHFRVFCELAKSHSLPIRAMRILPKLTGRLGALQDSGRLAPWKKLPKWWELQRVFNEVKNAPGIGELTSLSFIYMGHFDKRGALGQIRPDKLLKLSYKKRKVLRKFLNKQKCKAEPAFEVIAHIRIGDKIETHEAYKKEWLENHDYNEINPKYFDGRVVEYQSLFKFDYKDLLEQGYDWGRWQYDYDELFPNEVKELLANI